jgi:hypothetical protein
VKQTLGPGGKPVIEQIEGHIAFCAIDDGHRQHNHPDIEVTAHLFGPYKGIVQGITEEDRYQDNDREDRYHGTHDPPHSSVDPMHHMGRPPLKKQMTV